MLQAFLGPTSKYLEFSEIRENLKKAKAPIQVTGCIEVQKNHFISCVTSDYTNRVIITYSDYEARRMYEQYKLFDSEVMYYPAKDFIFFQADIQGKALQRERIEVLKRLVEKKPVTVITSIEAGMDKRRPLNCFADACIVIKVEEELDLDSIKVNLIRLGYEKCDQVSEPGTYAMRGGILDIYPFGEETPARVELWGDEVDNIRSFDPTNQRSIDNLSEVRIYPAMESVYSRDEIDAGLNRLEKEVEKVSSKLRETFKTEAAYNTKKHFRELKENLEFMYYATNTDSYITSFSPKNESFFDYFSDEDTVFILDEPVKISEQGKAVWEEYHDCVVHRLERGEMLPSQADAMIPYEKVLKNIVGRRVMALSTFVTSTKLPNAVNYGINAKSIVSYRSDFAELIKDVTGYKKDKYRIVIVSPSGTRGRRLADNLTTEYELPAFFTTDKKREPMPGEIMIIKGNLERGFEYPTIKYVVISESDIFGESKKEKKERKESEAKKMLLNSLVDGDYVIHENHGMAVYRGIHKIEASGVTKDYIKLEYAGNNTLYVPVTALDLIQKYASSEAKKPKLDSLNSGEWKKTKQRVKVSVNEIATELVELYAKRQQVKGFPFSPDTVWQKEFEELFPYEETKDQLKAIVDTKEDMERDVVMDRLVCGDVGYGKTEIALRAAFKAVQDSKQVAVLVPTTILCQQHYNTFVSRIGNFPVKVDFLSRFKSAAEQKKVLDKLAKGEIDIVIGTHRLLSKDVTFKNLGLLIVDEEQRFGVTHKEKIKQIKTSVDVLTLTATPIPRTMHMSLIGIRDMSILSEPPAKRIPVQTYVMEYNEELAREAISRELARGGQVYYVSNRVAGIEDVATRIKKMIPSANVVYAHGKMSETKLEKIMVDFINGEIDVLVSTTIIETGMDIPNVNTIIIENADKFGLSQLYQLRGRVGRSTRMAYAFLLYKKDKILKEEAEKRLSAIREFTELGAGYKIAMRDLEIRGAGNLLGERQSGHMSIVGYELYCKMLNEAVRKLKGESIVDDEYETSVDILLSAFIPDKYIKNEMIRLDVYKQIALVSSKAEKEDMLDELIDRFGDAPDSVMNLLAIAYLRSLAHKAYVLDVKLKKNILTLNMYPKAKLKNEVLGEFIASYKGKARLVTGRDPQFVFELSKNAEIEELVEEATAVLENMQQLIDETN